MKPIYQPVGGRRASDREDSSVVGSSPGRLGCLVFGLQSDRRQFLVQAARSAGWDAVEYTQDPIRVGPREFEGQRLIVFDLEAEDGSSSASLQSSAERAARQKGVLIVLCGNEGNAAEEIWARQLGVWLYLPGAVDNVDLADVFEEAARLDERRREERETRGVARSVAGRRAKPR